MESQSVDQELAKIGREYIIEALGDDIINKKIYFVCLLCNPMNPKKETFPLLDAHLGSEEHQWKFLVTRFPETAEIISSNNKKFSKTTTAKIVNCICKEIMKNIEPGTSSVFNYKAYETDTTLFHNDVLDKIHPYDSKAEFVKKMNRVLKKQTENAGYTIEVLESPEKSRDSCGIQEKMGSSQDTVILTPNISSESSVGESIVQATAPGIPEEVRGHEKVIKGEPSANKKVDARLIAPEPAKTVGEWYDDVTTSLFVSFSPVRDKKPLPAQEQPSEFKIVSIESLAPENSELDRRTEALVSLYKKKMRIKSQELDDHFQPYLKQPSSHPSFHDQWKTFYLKHNYAIVSSGARDFDYKPEWNIFWSRYLQQLKSQAYEKYESNLRSQLKIPESIPLTTKLDFQDLSDISDEELDFQSPMKRQRTDIDDYEPVKVFTDHDRMVIAYQLAYKHFQENKQLSTEELSSLVSDYCAQNSPEPIIRSQSSSSSQHLTDNDILILYKKFNSLSQNEQANLTSFVKSIEITDKKRYLGLVYKLKMQENDILCDRQLMKSYSQ